MSDILDLQRFKIDQMASSPKKVNSSAAITPLMAASAGVMAANICYNQPILKEVGLSINATQAEAGKIAMLSQLGYGLAL